MGAGRTLWRMPKRLSRVTVVVLAAWSLVMLGLNTHRSLDWPSSYAPSAQFVRDVTRDCPTTIVHRDPYPHKELTALPPDENRVVSLMSYQVLAELYPVRACPLDVARRVESLPDLVLVEQRQCQGPNRNGPSPPARRKLSGIPPSPLSTRFGSCPRRSTPAIAAATSMMTKSTIGLRDLPLRRSIHNLFDSFWAGSGTSPFGPSSADGDIDDLRPVRIHTIYDIARHRDVVSTTSYRSSASAGRT